MHLLNLKQNKLTPNFRRFEAFEGNIFARVFNIDENLYLVNKVDRLLTWQMIDNPQFNFDEIKLEFKNTKEGKGQLETKIEKLRVFTMI